MKAVLLAAILALLAIPSFASDRFAQMDRNNDGAVDWPEFEAVMPSMKKAAFDQIDANRDGKIVLPEWESFRSGHGKDGMGGNMPPAPNGANGLQMPPAGGNAAMPMIRPPAAQPGAAPNGK